MTRLFATGSLLALLLALTASPARAQRNHAPAPDDSVRTSLTYSDTLSLAARGTLTIENYRGSIAVSTWDRSAVGYTVRVVAEDFDGLLMLPDIDVQVERGPRGALTLVTDYTEALRGLQALYGELEPTVLPALHYTVLMPRTATLRIDDYMSAIDVDDLDADLTISSYQGTVAVRNLEGALQLGLFMGQADIGFAAFTRDSTIDTYEAAVDIRVPRDAGFDLAYDLGEASTFVDQGFRLAATPSVAARSAEYQINGGGPRLYLVNQSGSMRLVAQ